jgi:histidyl-tRNA synthetase
MSETKSPNNGPASERLQAVKGMYDLLPPDSRRLQEVERICHDLLQRHGYVQVHTPVVEYTPLFARSIGEETDIVEKEMYTFEDRDGRLLTLRPEGTAGVVRAYNEHAIHKAEPVTLWYYLGPMFRHERWQRGRYRQFHQLGVEALGPAGPSVDAEMLSMLVGLLLRLGLPAERMELHLNSLGCPTCRPTYRQSLLDFLLPHEPALCEDCQRRFRENPLRVLDCKVEGCRAIAAGAPTTLDSLCGECRDHWDGLLADLAALEVAYVVDHALVRGLDYYTRTTFELTSDAGSLGSQNTLAGGGRYDGLVELLGGPPTQAVGFAMGLERLLLALGDHPPLPPQADVCVVTRTATERRSALPLARMLREQGVRVEVDHRGSSIKSQMKRANRLGCSLVLILGEGELARGTVTVRRMDSSEQEEIPRAELAPRVLEWLGRK